MIDGREVSEALGEAPRLDGDLVLAVDRAGWDGDGSMRSPARLRKKRDEGFLQGAGAGALIERWGRSGGEDPSRVHGDQPVEPRRLLHVGRGDEHAHLRPSGTDACDQLPELRTRKRVHARGGLVEQKEVRVMDQGAAETELLLHAPGELSGGPVAEGRKAGALQQVCDPAAPLRCVVAEQLPEEVEVLEDRERRIEVLAQALRHIGDAGPHLGSAPGVGHVVPKHFHAARLDLARAGDEGEQGGLADAVGADQRHHAPSGNVQVDRIERHGAAVALADAPEARRQRDAGCLGAGHLALTVKRAGHCASGCTRT